MIKKIYGFFFRKLVVEPRIKRYLFHHLSKEDKEWLYRWHKSKNVLRPSNVLVDYIIPDYKWIDGVKGYGNITDYLIQGENHI